MVWQEWQQLEEWLQYKNFDFFVYEENFIHMYYHYDPSYLGDPSLAGTTWTMSLNLQTGEITNVPTLPEGWGRASSNPHYAFKYENLPYCGRSGCPRNLELMNLLTGEVTLLKSVAIGAGIAKDRSTMSHPKIPRADRS